MADQIIVPADIAAGFDAFELGLLVRVAESPAQPMPAGDAALVVEAIRLHALGKTL